MSLNHIVAGTATPLALECKSLDVDEVTVTDLSATTVNATTVNSTTLISTRIFSSMLFFRTKLVFGAKISAVDQYFIGNGANNANPTLVADNSIQATAPAHCRIVAMVITGATGVSGSDALQVYVNGGSAILQPLSALRFIYSPGYELFTGDVVTVKVSSKAAAFDDTLVELYLVEAS